MGEGESMIVSVMDADDPIRRRACVTGGCAMPPALDRRPAGLGRNDRAHT